jgi:hypothetical protein
MSTLQPPLPLTDSMLLIRPLKHLLFHSPLPEGEAMKQARSWHRAQLLDLRRLWELRRQHRISAGLIPMTQPPTMISDAVLGVENPASTVTATPPSSLTPLLTSPLESQCGPPFQPTAWRDLTSVVRRPRCWQLASLTVSSKTTKIPLRFCQHMTTEMNSPISSPRDSAFPMPKLPKGWVYEVAEASAEVKAEVADPSRYLSPETPLTCGKRGLADQLDDPHC